MRARLFAVVGGAALAWGAWLWWSSVSGLEGSSRAGAQATSQGGASRRGSAGQRGGGGGGGSLESLGTGSEAALLEGATPPVAEPMREEEGTLRVEVSTPSGPRKAARVMLYLRGPYSPVTGQPTWLLAGSGLTDEAGVAVLPARPGRYLATARAEGFATARAEVTRPRGEARTQLRLSLEPGATLEGSTVERGSRTPVPLVELTLTPRSFTPATLAWAPERVAAPEEERLYSVSDERGHFRFQGLAKGEYQLEAKAPGRAPKRLARVRVPSSGLTVELEASAFIEGFVELADGKPAPGATVSAFSAFETSVGDTGPGGGFSLDVAPGAYRLAARLGDKTGSSNYWLVVAPGMTLEGVRIRLGAAASIAGVVRRKDSGLPIADATVSIRPNTERGDVALAGLASEASVSARVSSTTEGRFEAGGLVPGAYDVTVQAQGFKSFFRRGITALEGQRFELLAELDANGRIEGTVVDGAKSPVAGIQVKPEGRWRPIEGAVSVVTDGSGGFALEDVPPGTVYVSARRPGSEVNTRASVTVDSGQTARVQLQLLEEGSLEGTVRLEGGGVPPRPVTVFARRVEAPPYEGIEVPARADGTWSMRAAAGRYQLKAWMTDAPNHGDEQAKVVELEAGQTQHVDLELHEGKKKLVVKVLEPGGAPSARAIVMGSEAGKSNILLEGMTDESGQVTLVADGLGSDALHLWATNGGRRGDVPSVPASRSEATVQLQPGARLTGSVRSAGGRAVNGFRLVVSVVRTDEDFMRQRELEFTGEQFVVEDVLPARLTVTATLADGRAGKTEVTTTSGATAQVEVLVEAGGSVTGRLRDARTGTPISEARVEVNGLTSPPTGLDGRFQFEDLAPGTHRITAWSQGHEIAEKQVTLTPGKTLDLGDWALGPPRVEPGSLGLSFGMSGREVTINQIIEGSPASVLQVGDVVLAVDGVTVLSPGEARQRELGAPGSQVTLAIRRGGQPLALTLHRAR